MTVVTFFSALRPVSPSDKDAICSSSIGCQDTCNCCRSLSAPYWCCFLSCPFFSSQSGSHTQGKI